MNARPLAIALLLATAAVACGGPSPRRLVDAGNAAVAAGRHDEALRLYDEAGIELPESAHLAFNRGVALFRKKDYAGARTAFEEAARRSTDKALEADARYNIGNAWFREAERQRDSDLRKSVDACRKSIDFFQQALQLEPGRADAAQNIEVVRLKIKLLLDALKKQQEEQQKQQQQKQDASKQIDDMIARQQQLQQQTRDQAGQPQPDTAPQAGEQQQLAQDARQQADQLRQQGAQDPAMQEAARQLDEAASQQAQAAGNLAGNAPKPALPRQDSAIDALKKAKDALARKQEPSQPQPQDNGQQEPQPQESQPQQAQAPEQPQEQPPPDEQAMQATDGSADDILEEEEENQKRRQRAQLQVRPVDKDW